MVTVSGGVGVLMADDANARGLDVAPMPEAAQRRMLELMPFAAAGNPNDFTGQFFNDPRIHDRAIELAAFKIAVAAGVPTVPARHARTAHQAADAAA